MPGCTAGWWRSVYGIIRCQEHEPPHSMGWWIFDRGAVADAPVVAPYRQGATRPVKWQVYPWRVTPIDTSDRPAEPEEFGLADPDAET